jgi:hypothetical protein
MPLDVLAGARQVIEGIAWFSLAFIACMSGHELLALRRIEPAVEIVLVEHFMPQSPREEIEGILGDLINQLTSDQRHLLADVLDRAGRAADNTRAV